MLLAMMLFPNQYMDIVAISFTALVLSELLNVASEIHKSRKTICGLCLMDAPLLPPKIHTYWSKQKRFCAA